LAFSSYGHRLGVRVNEKDALPRVLDCLPPGWKPVANPEVDCLYSVVVGTSGPRVRRFSLLYLGAQRIARTHDVDELFETLESNLKLHVAEMARSRLFVHAGVVGFRGRAIVLPGPSHAGKSTLVSALVDAGATYYSDEYAVFDDKGRVHPYARPLALRADSGRPDRKVAIVRAGKRPLPVGLVALTRYKRGARWRARSLSPGEALLALLENTLPVRRRPEAALLTLRRVVTGASVVKGIRGDAEDAVQRLLKEVQDCRS
jgi:hypothetical protein